MSATLQPAGIDAALVDFAALGVWMAQAGLPGNGFEDVERLAGGTQNVLIRFRRGGREYVLRRPPRHLRPRSNENLLREARVLGALTDTAVVSPALIASCADESVLGGAVFFLMESVEGFTAHSGLPELHAGDPGIRHRMGLNAVAALAELGAVDHVALGLADLGRPDGFLARQVPRWRAELESYGRYDGYPGTEIPGLDEVAGWLERTMPTSNRPGLMHGDYHLANLLFALDGPDVAAILDWEMCTVGDPLLDLGWLLATWPDPTDPAAVTISSLAGPLATLGGLPGADELVAHYAARSVRNHDAIGWYAVLACFKLGIVLEGTYARSCAGQADRTVGDGFHQIVLALFQRAKGFM